MSRAKKGAAKQAEDVTPITAASLALLFGDVTDRIAGIRWAWHVDRANHFAAVVLAYDLGINSAAALIDGTTVYLWAWRDPSAGMLRAPMRAAKQIAEGRPVLVGAEWSFVAPGLPNVATSLALAARAGAVCAIAELEELPAVRVLAHRWAMGLFGKRLPRAEGKERNARFARSLFDRSLVLREGPVDEATEDETDATCFAAWMRGETAR